MPYCKFIFLFLVAFGAQNFGARTLRATPLTGALLHESSLLTQAKLIHTSKRCGMVYFHPGPTADEPWARPADGFLSYAGEQRHKKKLKWFKRVELDEYSYQTREAKVFLFDPQTSDWSKQQAKHHLRSMLEQRLTERATTLFREETAGLAGLEQTAINDLLGQIDAKLLQKDENPAHAERRIKILMALYPQLRDDIVNNADDELRPLLCVYEGKQHTIKIGRRWSNVLVVSALALGVTSIVVGTQGVAAPALVITAGTLAVGVGARDIAWGIYSWTHKEKGSQIAKRFRLALKEVKKTVANLEKKAETQTLTSAEQDLLVKFRDIDTAFPAERRKKLGKVARAKHLNRMVIAMGVLNAGFNGVNLTGDATILARLPEMILDLIGVI